MADDKGVKVRTIRTRLVPRIGAVLPLKIGQATSKVERAAMMNQDWLFGCELSPKRTIRPVAKSSPEQSAYPSKVNQKFGSIGHCVRS